MTPIRTMMPYNDKAKIKEQCEQYGLTISAWSRQAIQDVVSNAKKPRPSTKGDASYERLIFRIDDKSYKKVQRIADDNDWTTSHALRNILRFSLEKQQENDQQEQ